MEAHQPISSISPIHKITKKMEVTYLSIPRISIEHIAKEFTRASDAGDDETVNIETVYYEEMCHIEAFL